LDGRREGVGSVDELGVPAVEGGSVGVESSGVLVEAEMRINNKRRRWVECGKAQWEDVPGRRKEAFDLLQGR
jgi:hypothetical protein